MHFRRLVFSAFLAASAAATPISGATDNNVPDGAPGVISLVGRAEAKVLTKKTLLQAMKDASGKTAACGEAYTMIIQGGAVNVVLDNRASTGDMDFIATIYDPDKPAPYEKVLEQLKIREWKYAYDQAKKRGEPIPYKWYDSSISLYFRKPALFRRYKSEAEAQNTVLSTAGMDPDDETGIKYIAAPWDWQFVGKMAKHFKPYDLDDALFYLQRWLQMKSKTSVDFNDVRGWFSYWEIPTPSNLAPLCREVNTKARNTLITAIP